MSRIQRLFQLAIFIALFLFTAHVMKTMGFVRREGFYQTTAAAEEGMPWWQILLIVLAVVGAVGGVVYWFWKSRAPVYNNGSYRNNAAAY
jgi:TRAP-type mannitol/chloroaromatic compound transport system permease small subunit